MDMNKLQIQLEKQDDKLQKMKYDNECYEAESTAFYIQAAWIYFLILIRQFNY